jgi:hypothetical protein
VVWSESTNNIISINAEREGLGRLQKKKNSVLLAGCSAAFFLKLWLSFFHHFVHLLLIIFNIAFLVV